VLAFPPRGGRPDLLTIARSVAAYAGMAGGLGAGLWAGLLKRSHREAVNRSAALIGDLGLAIAGIEIRVRGEDHLWSHRPAMFLFNHQSQLDVLILAKLLRENYTGVAKANTRNVPGFGQFFQFAGVAFVEPGHKARNRAALAPAAEKLKSGLSLVMAPEGTRSPTPRLGATFRKGAFHLAMQARVPIVPIVIRNAGALLRRGEVALRPGTVDVAVLPPIPTTRWRVKDLDRHVTEVRQMFVDTLEKWPGVEEPDPPAPSRSRARRPTPRRAPRKAAEKRKGTGKEDR
jgi:putative phosphoserine phosphatase/1-acylglycerol-3-phosphate O-acyltransferase